MSKRPCPRADILLAEDDAKLRELLLEVLADFGFEASAAASGRAALDRIRERKPDLLLCDVLMPDGDGHDVLRVIRADRGLADLPVIFLSALARVADVRAGMNLGADDYLTKPLALADLRRAVEARLERASVLREGAVSGPIAAGAAEGIPWPAAEAGGPEVPRGTAAEATPRVDVAWAGELARALGEAEHRGADLMLLLRPGWVALST